MEINSKSDPYLRKIISGKKQVAVIPIGSIEQHGPHLPVSTDSDIVTEISRQLSERENYLLLPTITFGVSFEHSPFFNLSVTKSTLKKILLELCISLGSNGIKSIFIINGHHGNMKAIRNIGKKLKNLSNNRIRVYTLSYWDFMEREFDHAGFVETSLMLTISNQVKIKLAKKGLMLNNKTEKQIRRLKDLASKSFPKATKNGVWGDPTKATKKDGKKILSEIVGNLQKKCQTCLTGSGPNLHQ